MYHIYNALQWLENAPALTTHSRAVAGLCAVTLAVTYRDTFIVIDTYNELVVRTIDKNGNTLPGKPVWAN